VTDSGTGSVLEQENIWYQICIF